MSKLSPFSYVILVLVGEGGAGPHDLVQMMRNGRVYWTAPESQFYAEPKRLEQGGYLEAAKQPGRTHAKTHYSLTPKGREALRGWLATPARFPRIQNEAVVRLLGAEYADRGELLTSLQSLECAGPGKCATCQLWHRRSNISRCVSDSATTAGMRRPQMRHSAWPPT